MTAGATSTSRGVPVDALDEIDSTNLEAMRRAAAGERGPLWISARRQRSGRGRSGRDWISAPGNLAATLLVSPVCPPAALHQLSLVTGVALHDALTALAPAADVAALRLKWPNDLMIGPAKLAGILVETSTFHGETVAAIGVGVNVAHAPHVPGRPTARLIDLAPAIMVDELLDPIDCSIARWFETWRGGEGFAAVRKGWLERCVAIGTPIVVHALQVNAFGSFAGIDDDGALLLRDEQRRIHRYTAGDVRLTAIADE
jgi:BirA family biotin operon repressor/biotin-[acetyl-CoA-carboxylase] ligase